jgi:hypothetical protein
MKPKLNTMVHYRAYGTPGGEFLPECRTAIIVGIPKRTRAASSKGEDLYVITPTGEHHNRCLQDEETKAGGTWHYPCDTESEKPALPKVEAES